MSILPLNTNKSKRQPTIPITIHILYSKYSGLKNDTSPETFPLRHSLNGHYFPCRYIKIVPLQSWGPSFNFSIWHVSVEGEDSTKVIEPSLAWHDQVVKKIPNKLLTCYNKG